jgi:hypothetical protein
LRITDSVDDALLELAIEAASREIDSATERQFFPTNATRIYTPRDSYVVEIDDLTTLTTLKTSSAADGTFDITWTASDYQLEPLNGLTGGITVPYTQIRAVGDYTFPIEGGEATVQVVGSFGFATAPTAIKQATVLLASRIFKRNDSPLGVAGFGDLGVVRVSRLDPDVDAMIAPYKKVRFA